jgi:hypothetical protein
VFGVHVYGGFVVFNNLKMAQSLSSMSLYLQKAKQANTKKSNKQGSATKVAKDV